MKIFFGSILFTILIFTLFSVTVAAQTIDQPNVRAFLLNQDPDPAKAGDVIDVRLRFQNTGGAEARNIWVEFTQEYPFTLLTGEEKRQTIESLPNWPEEENSKTVTFKFRVDREAVDGQYEIKFRYSTDEGTIWVLKDFNIDVTTKEFAEIIYIDKTILMPGKETEMTFTINNIGNAPLQSMVFSWNEANGIVLPVSTDNTRYIKYLGPGESIPLKYTVIASVNVNPDLYELNLNLEYDVKNDSGSTSKETVSTKAGIFVGGETDFDVTFSESSQGQTSLSVANVGSNPALSVTVRVPRQEGFRVQGSTDAIVGNLDKGDYTIVSFQIISFRGLGEDTREQERREELSEEERQQLRQQLAGRGNNLKVIIDYTDTTGARQTLEKTVPIQFRSFGAADGAVEGGQGEHAPGQFEGRRQQQSKIGYVITLVIVIGGLGIYFWVRKKKPSFLSKILRKKKKS